MLVKAIEEKIKSESASMGRRWFNKQQNNLSERNSSDPEVEHPGEDQVEGGNAS